MRPVGSTGCGPVVSAPFHFDHLIVDRLFKRGDDSSITHKGAEAGVSGRVLATHDATAGENVVPLEDEAIVLAPAGRDVCPAVAIGA